MADLVSVIVPVYKVEEYLGACIDSIRAQTYERLEIILVDDGSPDGCADICDRYAQMDDRIVVIHKDNGGQADARNAGVLHAQGEWIVFVDSDDVVHRQYVELLYAAAKREHADMAVCGYQKWKDCYTATELVDVDGMQTAAKNTTEALSALLYQQQPYETAPWGKIYRRGLFLDISYPAGLIYEDLATTYRLVMRCQTIAQISIRLYGYRIRQGSTMHASDPAMLLSCVQVSRQLYADVRAYDASLAKAAASRAFSVNRAVYLMMDWCHKTQRTQIWQEMKRYRGIVLADSHARSRERMMALFSYTGQRMTHALSGWYQQQQDDCR